LNKLRFLDAKIAEMAHGFKWSTTKGDRKFLLLPKDYLLRTWSTVWDDDGIPTWLPEFHLTLVGANVIVNQELVGRVIEVTEDKKFRIKWLNMNYGGRIGKYNADFILDNELQL